MSRPSNPTATRAFVLAGALWAAAACAHAQDGPTVNVQPLFITAKVTTARLDPSKAADRLYPDEARAKKIEADVTVACRIVAGGETTDCRVQSESVAGMGFGQKALLAWSRIKKPLTLNGQLLGGGMALIPLRFRVQKGAFD
jgi:TonB family protein